MAIAMFYHKDIVEKELDQMNMVEKELDQNEKWYIFTCLQRRLIKENAVEASHVS